MFFRMCIEIIKKTKSKCPYKPELEYCGYHDPARYHKSEKNFVMMNRSRSKVGKVLQGTLDLGSTFSRQEHVEHSDDKDSLRKLELEGIFEMLKRVRCEEGSQDSGSVLSYQGDVEHSDNQVSSVEMLLKRIEGMMKPLIHMVVDIGSRVEDIHCELRFDNGEKYGSMSELGVKKKKKREEFS